MYSTIKEQVFFFFFFHSSLSFVPNPNQLPFCCFRCSRARRFASMYSSKEGASPSKDACSCSRCFSPACSFINELSGVDRVFRVSEAEGDGVTASGPPIARQKVPKAQSIASSTGLSKRYGKNGTTPRPSFSHVLALPFLSTMDGLILTPIGTHLRTRLLLASLNARPEYRTTVWIVKAGSPIVAMLWNAAR